MDHIASQWHIFFLQAQSRSDTYVMALSLGHTSSEVLESVAQNLYSKTELAQLRGYTFSKRRTSFLQGRFAAKVAIKALFIRDNPTIEFDPRQVEVINGVLGQPVLLGAPGLGVSLAHCGGVAAAVAYPLIVPMGIDLEWVEPTNAETLNWQVRPAELDLALSSFASPRLNSLTALTMIWSLKEALAKALGCGLTASLDIFNVNACAFHKDGFSTGYSHFAGHKGVATFSGDLVLALAAPDNINLEVNLLAVSQALGMFSVIHSC